MKGYLTAALAALVSAALPALVSCTKEDGGVNVPALTVSTPETAPSEGGSFTISYSVTDPADNGEISASADVTWIHGFDTSAQGTVVFTVDENLSGLRTGTITVSYRYGGSIVSRKVALFQTPALSPQLSVSPDAIVAGYFQDVYSFACTVEDPVPDGVLSCSSEETWIGDINCGEDGTAVFQLATNLGDDIRTGTVTATYSYSGISISRVVTVIQDHAANGGRLSFDEIFGDYTAAGYCRVTSTTAEYRTWRLNLAKKSDIDKSVYIDGLLPYTEDGFATYGDHRMSACGIFIEKSQSIVVPSDVNGTTVSVGGSSYWLGFTPCVSFTEDGGFSYSTGFPNLIIMYDPATKTWESDYGIMAVGCLSEDIGTTSVYFDAVAPTFTLTETE